MVYYLSPLLGDLIDAITRKPVAWFLIREPSERSWIVLGLIVLWLFTWWLYKRPVNSLRSKIRFRTAIMKLEELLRTDDGKTINNIIRDASSGEPVKLPDVVDERPSVGSMIKLSIMGMFGRLLGFIIFTMYVIESIVLVFILFFI